MHENYGTQARVAVSPDTGDERIQAKAAALATELGLPLAAADCPPGQAPNLLLVIGERRLELREARRSRVGPIFADFVGRWRRLRYGSGLSRRQPIARAVGLRRGPVTVVDATAGLARDSLLLAALGCTVIAVERCAVLGSLIRDGLQRAALEGAPEIHPVLDRITLIVDDARNVLAEMVGPGSPDVVYLDPMYPPKKKSALPNKEMRVCRRLVGDDPDAGELLAVARRAVRKRVVVKRHSHAPPLAPAPNMQFIGKLVRYDVYHPLA